MGKQKKSTIKKEKNMTIKKEKNMQTMNKEKNMTIKKEKNMQTMNKDKNMQIMNKEKQMSSSTLDIITFLADFGADLKASIDNITRLQLLAFDMLDSPKCEALRQDPLARDFKKTFFAVPYLYLKASSNQFVDFFKKLNDGDYDEEIEEMCAIDAADKEDSDEEEDSDKKECVEEAGNADKEEEAEESEVVLPSTSKQTEKIMPATNKPQNNRPKGFQQNRRQRQRAKKAARKTSGKQSFNNLQRSTSKNARKRNVALINSREIIQSNTEDQPKKMSRRQKRKTDDVNESLNKSAKSKELKGFIKLNDFMTDLFAEDDPYVVQYIKSEPDSNSANSDGVDNKEDGISTKSHESDSDEEEDMGKTDASVSNSDAESPVNITFFED